MGIVDSKINLWSSPRDFQTVDSQSVYAVRSSLTNPIGRDESGIKAAGQRRGGIREAKRLTKIDRECRDRREVVVRRQIRNISQLGRYRQRWQFDVTVRQEWVTRPRSKS